MTERTTVVFMCLVYITFAQLPPIWQTSPYIEAKDIIVVAGDQKTFGTYTLTVNFEATFVTPIIILGNSSSIQPFRNCVSKLTRT